MSQTWGGEIHAVGEFNIHEQILQGEIVCREDGTILLELNKTLRDNNSFDLTGTPFYDMPMIFGKLNTGVCVKLYNAKLIVSTPHVLSHQSIRYIVEYVLETTANKETENFTRFRFKIENGVEWSELSHVQTNLNEIKILEQESRVVNWFGEKITFFTTVESPLWSYPKQERIKVEERLNIYIESNERHELPYFLTMRDKILAMISFATKSNLNVLEQYAENDCETAEIDFHIGGYKVTTSEPYKSINYILPKEYNFKLTQLIGNGVQMTTIDKLMPVLNLYLSLFKYKDMPYEMRFLNIVQAIETFHARFFSNECKKKSEHEARIRQQYSKFIGYKEIEDFLLPDQSKNDITHITLLARINELLFDNGSKLFYHYCVTEKDFAQTIVRTRNYFTHFDSELEKYALKGDNLINAIRVLRVILEYHICKVLGVDNAAIARVALKN